MIASRDLGVPDPDRTDDGLRCATDLRAVGIIGSVSGRPLPAPALLAAFWRQPICGRDGMLPPQKVCNLVRSAIADEAASGLFSRASKVGGCKGTGDTVGKPGVIVPAKDTVVELVANYWKHRPEIYAPVHELSAR